MTGDRARLGADDCERLIELHGPGGRRVSIEMDDQWLGLDTGRPTPLHVGKTAGAHQASTSNSSSASSQPAGVTKAHVPEPDC